MTWRDSSFTLGDFIMSHEITETDRVLLAGKQAWHGLGIVLPDAFTVADALTVGQLDWTVEQSPLYLGDGSQVLSHVANVRSDTNETLAIVGSEYSVLQNRDLATYVEDVCGDEVRLETAGSLKGGRKVFMLARMETFDATPGDPVQRYGLFSNDHTGMGSLFVLPTSIRVVCNNTLTMALGSKRSGIAVRHTKGLADSLESARAALTGAIVEGDKFREQVVGMVSRKLNTKELHAFFATVYAKANRTKITVNPTTDAEARTFRKATKTVGDWCAILDDEKNLVGDMRGSIWAALNAITQWSDHERTVRLTGSLTKSDDDQAKAAEARLYSNWLGSSADFKAVAFKEALVAFATAPGQYGK